jgi:hypothetical protein
LKKKGIERELRFRISNISSSNQNFSPAPLCVLRAAVVLSPSAVDFQCSMFVLFPPFTHSPIHPFTAPPIRVVRVVRVVRGFSPSSFVSFVVCFVVIPVYPVPMDRLRCREDRKTLDQQPAGSYPDTV